MTRPASSVPVPPLTAVVIDASAVVALLADAGSAGQWVARTIAGAALSAPELMPYEVGNVLRRRETAGQLDPGMATLAHRDLCDLAVDLYPFAATAPRAWELRHNLTGYDAAYAALAERLGVPLITLDARLAAAPGPRCRMLSFDR